MSIIAKMHVDDKVFTLLSFNFSLEQRAGYNGFPSSKPTGGVFNIVFESTKDELFLQWLISEAMIESLKIVLSPTSMASKSRTILLLDLYCLRYVENFNGVNTQPMATYIQASPATMIQDGVKIFEKSWKVTDLDANATPTSIENDPEFIGYFITDLKDNELDNYNTGDKIRLHIETKNTIGNKLTLSLNDKTRDFKHNGTILQNDTLKDYPISSDLEKIELEVIDQQN